MRKQWRDSTCGRGIVRGLHAEEHDFRAAHGVNFSRCFHTYFFLKLKRVEHEPVLLDGLDEWRASDHGDRRARAGEQPSEISADGACADDGDSGPRL